jgi:hypothetical protein
MFNNPRPEEPEPPQSDNQAGSFIVFRDKVRSGDVLSSSIEALLHRLNFTGNISVQVQNGHVLKSGYEEGYFRQRPGR